MCEWSCNSQAIVVDVVNVDQLSGSLDDAHCIVKRQQYAAMRCKSSDRGLCNVPGKSIVQGDWVLPFFVVFRF